jgi:hypothetical protein
MNLQVMVNLPEPRELLAAMQEFSRRDQSFRKKYRQLLQQFEEQIADEEQRFQAMCDAHHEFEMGKAMMGHHDPYVFYDDDSWQ